MTPALAPPVAQVSAEPEFTSGAEVAGIVAQGVTEPATPELKEQTMAAKPDFTTAEVAESVSAAFSDMQDKARLAYEKGTAAMNDFSDFAKGNVEAMVESGRILAGGLQDLGKSAAEDAKSVYEVATADLRQIAEIKSPTEMFQVQGRIARRNFDTLVATGSKNAEAMIKLVNHAFAPLSGRINLAVEKVSKVA